MPPACPGLHCMLSVTQEKTVAMTRAAHLVVTSKRSFSNHHNGGSVRLISRPWQMLRLVRERKAVRVELTQGWLQTAFLILPVDYGECSGSTHEVRIATAAKMLPAPAHHLAKLAR